MISRHSDEDFTQAKQENFDWSCREDRDVSRAFTSLRQLLGPRAWVEADGLNDMELITLLNDLEFDLLQRQVQVDFLDTLPPRAAYKGILQLLDSPIEVNEDSYRIQHLDGCDSACESCFQLAYCSVAREVLGKEWHLAVEQAGINPSWSALFSADEED